MLVISRLDRNSGPCDGDADISGHAAGKIDDLIADAITAGLQVIGPELKYLFRYSGQRFLPAWFLLVDRPTLVGAKHVGKSINLNFGQAISHRPLNDIGGELDLLVLRKSGRLAEPLDQRSLLGFGGSGRDLFKSYALRLLATETVAGIAADKLELIPKSDRLRNNIARIWLWIDPARGISLQQQFFEPDGNYRLAKYSDIRINQPLPENAFKLKTTKRTRFVSPQG